MNRVCDGRSYTLASKAKHELAAALCRNGCWSGKGLPEGYAEVPMQRVCGTKPPRPTCGGSGQARPSTRGDGPDEPVDPDVYPDDRVRR